MEGSSWLLDGDEGSPTMEPLPEHSQEDARKNERIGELEGLKQEQRTRSNVEALREEQRVANRRLLGEVTKVDMLYLFLGYLGDSQRKILISCWGYRSCPSTLKTASPISHAPTSGEISRGSARSE